MSQRPVMIFLALFLVVFASLQAAQPVSAAVLTVNTLNDTVANDAFCSLREALAAAQANANSNGCTGAGYGNDVINFSVNGTLTLTAPLSIASNVTVDGPGANLLTITGNHTITISGGVTVTIDDLKIANRTAQRIIENGSGNNLTLTNVIFQNNGTGTASAIFSLSPLTINTSTFTGNSGTGSTNSLIESGGPLNINNSTFTNNSFGESGVLDASTGATITSSIFNGNQATAPAAGTGAGAISNMSGLTITSSTFSNNTSAGDGGAIAFYGSGGGTITASSFVANTANGKGGGIYKLGGSELHIRNSTFSGNSAGTAGGGFYSGYETSWIVFTTFSGNSAPEGGGLFNGGGTIHLYNSILANSPSGGDCYLKYVTATSSIYGGPNMIETPCTFVNAYNNLSTVITADPMLAPLTGTPGYHALLPGSPAIDIASQNNIQFFNITTDQLGNPRFYDDLGVYDDNYYNPPPVADLGSVERQTNGFPKLSINNVTLTEGNSGTKAFNFTVALSHRSDEQITVNYATSNGTATAGSDYTAIPLTLFTFYPGESSKQITVNVTGDLMHEAHENFNVNLSSPTNATITDNLGVGQINNDDSKPTITVSDLNRTEGGSGTQTNMPFTVTLSNPSYQTVTVQFATSDGTATSADGDYAPLSLTTLTFTPGQTSRSVIVKINGDAKHEPHETLNLNLSNPTNASIVDALGVGTIANDDSKPSIIVNNVSQPEGNSGTTNFPFVVTLSNPSYQTITVNFATSNVSASAGTDYTARSGSLSFAPGVTTRTVTVLGNGDTTVEPNETFNFNLSSAVNATIGDPLGVGTITNDDNTGLVAPLTLSAFAASVNEGQSTTYTIALNAAPADLLGSDSVNVSLTFDPAYLSVTPASLTFDAANWNVPQTVTITAVDDQQALQASISLPVLHTLTSGDVSLNGTPFGLTITDNDALLVPVAPELPQIEAVAPVSPDAPVQPVEPSEAVPLLPAGAATGNPVMFMWRAATGASSYSLHITTESGERVYEGVFSAAVDCAGEICQGLPDVALTSGVNYLWSIQADDQLRSFAMAFTYTDTTFSPIVTP